MKEICLIFITVLFLRTACATDNILDAEQAIKKGAELSSYTDYKTHPLYPYLEYRYYQNNFKKIPIATLVTFFKENSNAPYASWLASTIFPEWLRDGEYSAIINAYSTNFPARKVSCDYRLALLKENQQSKAKEGIDNLWLSANSIDNECDSLFDAMIANGTINQDLIAQRFRLAMSNNNVSLAKYLATELDGTDQINASIWLSAIKSEQNINQSLTIRGQEWRNDAFANIIKHYTHKNRELAYNFAIMVENGHHSHKNNTNFNGALNELTGKLARADDARSETIFNLIPAGQHQKNATLDLIAYELRQKNWQKINDLLNSLDENERSGAEYQYWLAKSSEKIGNFRQAKRHYQKAAQQRDFFGFLAAEKINKNYQLNDRPLMKDDATYDSVLAYPAVYRILTFLSLDEYHRAGLEFNSIRNQLSDAQKLQAAIFFSENNWPIQSVILMSQLKNWDALTIRFPVKYAEAVNQAAQKTHLSPATIYAIIRKESIFQPEIRSHVGALGLMQVMPATGKHTARKYHIAYQNAESLYHPQTNIEIGSQYLKDQIQKFGNLAYAAAAYNAGPERAEQWKAEYPDLPVDEWIAQIPFYETRNYVKGVLEYEKIYEYRLNLEHQKFSQSFKKPW